MIGKELSLTGVTVVSGLARGIDARAHAGALEAGGPVIGVLGCGVDVVYPKEHAKLFERVMEQGCLISEFVPGTRPLPGNFPLRNRIMSGLSQATVVVEAGEKSGALITADHALSQGRDVYAVPGSIFSPACEGSNRLLLDGATPFLKTADIVAAYGWETHGKTGVCRMPDPPQDPLQKKIYALLTDEPSSFENLAEALEIETGKLNSILTIMELSGIITQLSGRMFSLPRHN
jgi:DNA processing protein